MSCTNINVSKWYCHLKKQELSEPTWPYVNNIELNHQLTYLWPSYIASVFSKEQEKEVGPTFKSSQSLIL